MDYFDWIDVWVSFGFVIRKQIKNVENDKKKSTHMNKKLGADKLAGS